MGATEKEMKGYEFCWGQESVGTGGTRGVKIWLRESKRTLVVPQKRRGYDGLDKDDWMAVHKAADELEKAIWFNTVKRDPEGPALRLRYRHDITRAFFDAGLDPIYVEEIPNEYCKDPCCFHRPWFNVTCEFGHVHLGWRKSVVHLDWAKTEITHTGNEIFPDSTSTKGGMNYDSGDGLKGRYIHCWGFGDVVRVLKDLRGWNRLVLGTHYPKLPFGDYRDDQD